MFSLTNITGVQTAVFWLTAVSAVLFALETKQTNASSRIPLTELA